MEINDPIHSLPFYSNSIGRKRDYILDNRDTSRQCGDDFNKLLSPDYFSISVK